jgi:hypothetical protein
MLALNGKKVELAYDPLDLGKAAIYFDSRFIGLADCIALRRMGEDAFVQDERDRRLARRQVKQLIKAVHQAVPVPDAETHFARRRAVAPERAAVARVEVPAQIPEGVARAHAAMQAERAAVLEPVAVLRVERPSEPEDDGTFVFFRDAPAEPAKTAVEPMIGAESGPAVGAGNQGD